MKSTSNAHYCEAAVRHCASVIASQTPRTRAQHNIALLILGAVYGFLEAGHRGYVEGWFESNGLDRWLAFADVAKGLATETGSFERSLLAGFYFNSALLRMDAANELLSKLEIEDPQLARTMKVNRDSIVRKKVNRWKHDVEGLYWGAPRFEEAVAMLESLTFRLDAICKHD